VSWACKSHIYIRPPLPKKRDFVSYIAAFELDRILRGVSFSGASISCSTTKANNVVYRIDSIEACGPVGSSWARLRNIA